MLYLITYAIVINDEPNFIEQESYSIAVDACNKVQALHYFIEHDDESFRSFIASLLGTEVWDTIPNERLEFLRNLYQERDLGEEIQYDGYFNPAFTGFIEEYKRDILDILREYLDNKVLCFRIKKLKIITPLGGFSKGCKKLNQ